MEAYRFSGSVRLAIQFVLGLTRRERTDLHPDLTVAVWCNFDFFSAIRPYQIKRLKRVERADQNTVGYWEVKRFVAFYFRNQVVAEVLMVGTQQDKSGVTPRCSYWKVSQIRYARRFDSKEPEDWVDASWDTGATTMTDMDGVF